MKLSKTWEEKELQEVAQISAGGTPRRDIKKYWENGTIPWLKISDLKNVYINDSKEKITKKGLENSSAKLFPKGTIVFSIFATIGATGILNIEAATNQAIAGINPNYNLVDTKYLYYCLKSEKKRLIQKKSHATQDNINLTKLKKHKIPLPSLKTQKQIVSILEQAEKLKEKRKQANELLKQLPQSIFFEMFGASNKSKFSLLKLNNVCEKITDGSHTTPKILKEGYPFLTVANMREFDFNYENCKRISKEDYEKLVKTDCKPLKGDVLFSKDGTVGKVMEIRTEKEEVLLSSIAILRSNKSKILPTFLAEFLKTDYALTQAIEKKSGSAIRRIILKDIKTLKIPLPSIEEQKKIVETTKFYRKLKEKQNQSTEEINVLFDVLMQKAFNGELVS